eukprot:6070072-Alexandrium_andersonii.AAC.1
MSASLVGSEMCIRDRNSTDNGKAARLQDDHVSPQGSYQATVRVGGLCPCLLYTSDAADDM